MFLIGLENIKNALANTESLPSMLSSRTGLSPPDAIKRRARLPIRYWRSWAEGACAACAALLKTKKEGIVREQPRVTGVRNH